VMGGPVSEGGGGFPTQTTKLTRMTATTTTTTTKTEGTRPVTCKGEKGKEAMHSGAP
jgi:hypothetical protein